VSRIESTELPDLEVKKYRNRKGTLVLSQPVICTCTYLILLKVKNVTQEQAQQNLFHWVYKTKFELARVNRHPQVYHEGW
jgi:hypothetical protein